MKSLKVSFIEISFFSHATEDDEKVLTAVNNILPPDLKSKVEFKKSTLRGYYGNPILFFKGTIRKNDAFQLFTHIFTNLSNLEHTSYLRDIELYFDKGTLFLRLDKQSAFQGAIRLGKADPIHLKIKFKGSNIKCLIETLKEIHS